MEEEQKTGIVAVEEDLGNETYVDRIAEVCAECEKYLASIPDDVDVVTAVASFDGVERCVVRVLEVVDKDVTEEEAVDFPLGSMFSLYRGTMSMDHGKAITRVAVNVRREKYLYVSPICPVHQEPHHTLAPILVDWDELIEMGLQPQRFAKYIIPILTRKIHDSIATMPRGEA